MSQAWIYTIVYFAWLIGAACFVLGLHLMNSPATGRNGNRLSASGMVIAVGATFVGSETGRQIYKIGSGSCQFVGKGGPTAP